MSNNHITAKLIAASLHEYCMPIYTIEATYPRYIHSQLMTHRQFSRNSASSRAIPIETMIKGVEDNIWYPEFMP